MREQGNHQPSALEKIFSSISIAAFKRLGSLDTPSADVVLSSCTADVVFNTAPPESS
jgi:hypothetical protein